MKQGDIVLVSLPQDDKQIKKRPVLLLKKLPGFGDWLVCGISTQLHQYIPCFDEIIDKNHTDFKSSGLIAPSVVRLAFIARIPASKIPGTIGSLSSLTITKIITNLIDFLKKP
ncbi:MAG: type II toxin-antitoxin system PemK/MazF family toxin [Bacteroidia bacterium]